MNDFNDNYEPEEEISYDSFDEDYDEENPEYYSDIDEDDDDGLNDFNLPED